jgi:hypothetical protein
VLVEPGLPDLRSYANPAVPELRGKVDEKALAEVVDGPFSIHEKPPSEIIDDPLVTASHLA